MNLKEKFQEEKEKLKPMTRKEKLEYFWEYYKLWLIGFVVVVGFLASIISAQIQNAKPTYLSAVFINATIPEENTLEKDYIQYTGINKKKVNTSFDFSLTINDEATDEYSYQSLMKLVALFAAKSIDVTVMNEHNFETYAAQEAFYTLKDVLPADVYETYQDRMITGSKEDGTTYVCGIDVSDSKIVSKYYTDADKPIFSIVINAKEPDHAVDFLKFLYLQN